ncbi:MAG: PAS domain-containing protein [Lachnospiraceae bacterium]|nr:PAS domain-containing protein [Lachnospiraceae bacterium]
MSEENRKRRDRYVDEFALTKYTLPVVWQMAEVIPGGFFIYREDEKRELIYSNSKVHEIFGCKNLAEFKEYTGYTFQGMVHPDDFAKIQGDIDSQIDSEEGDAMDHVVYRIKRKDGEIRWVDDYGHFSHSPEYGDVYYVFINDITEAKQSEEAGKTLEALPGKIGQILERAAEGDYEAVNEGLAGLKESLS